MEPRKRQGLVPGGHSGSRAHVHTATNLAQVRPNSEVIVEVNLEAMYAAGLDLHVSANNYVHSEDTISPRFFLSARANVPASEYDRTFSCQ